MADKREGVLVRIVKNFGFIKPDDGGPEIFVHQARYPGLMTVGSRLSFEESEPDPARDGKTQAQNVEVTNRVPPPVARPVATPAVAATPAIVAPVATPAKAKTEDVVNVSWRFENPIAQFGLIMVKAFIKFLRDGSSASDLKVSLFKVDHEGNRTLVKTPSPKATPNDVGEAYFALYLVHDVEYCDLVAIAGGKEYPHPWSKNPPVQTAPVQVPASGTPDPTATPTPATGPSTLEVEKSGPDANGVYTFRITAIPNKDVTIGGNVTLEPQGPFATDNKGLVVIEVKVRDKGLSGEIDFRCESLISKPRYVTSKK